jgi:hypothetical protein
MRASIFYRLYYWILKNLLPYHLKPHARYFSDLKLRRLLDELITPDELRTYENISAVQHWGEEEPAIFSGNEGIIAISSSSQFRIMGEDGYFSGTGSIEIKNGKLSAYDYDLKYTKDEGGIVFYASSGHSDYTINSSGSGFFDNIETNKHYVQRISDTLPVEPPGITPSTNNLVEDITYDWQGGMISTITGSDWDSGTKQQDWRVEYTYDGSNRLTNISEGVLNGTTITRYYNVSLFSNHDANGFPQEERNYQSDIDNLTTNPTDRPESFSITCGPASALNGTYGRYFLFFSDTTEYYVWYNVGGQDDPEKVVPSLIPKTDIIVNILSGDSEFLVASKTATAINNVVEFSATNPALNFVSVNTVSNGDVTDAIDGNTGFDVSVLTQGLSAEITNYEYTYGTEDTPKTITINDQYMQEFIYDASGNIEMINYYENLSGWVLVGTQTFTIPVGLSLKFDDISLLKNPVGSEILDKILVF